MFKEVMGRGRPSEALSYYYEMQQSNDPRIESYTNLTPLGNPYARISDRLSELHRSYELDRHTNKRPEGRIVVAPEIAPAAYQSMLGKISNRFRTTQNLDEQADTLWSGTVGGAGRFGLGSHITMNTEEVARLQAETRFGSQYEGGVNYQGTFSRDLQQTAVGKFGDPLTPGYNKPNIPWNPKQVETPGKIEDTSGVTEQNLMQGHGVAMAMMSSAYGGEEPASNVENVDNLTSGNNNRQHYYDHPMNESSDLINTDAERPGTVDTEPYNNQNMYQYAKWTAS